MDKKEPGRVSSENVTRESLIAISYRVPDKDLTTEKLPTDINGDKVVEPPTHDGKEKYRAKLISISDYTPSSDVKAQPNS